MEIQLAVRTPTTAALGSTPIFIQAEVTRGIKIVRVARFDITCVRINGIMKKTAMITYVFVLFPMILIIRSATTSPAPVTLIASDNASTPANRKIVGMWMDSNASFSESTPVSTEYCTNTCDQIHINPYHIFQQHQTNTSQNDDHGYFFF